MLECPTRIARNARQIGLIGLLALAIDVACAGPSQGPPSGADISTPRTATASPVALATTLATPEEDLDLRLERLEASVVALRGLRPSGPTPRHFVDATGLQEVILSELDDPETLTAIEEEQRLYKLLGLIDQDVDLAALYQDLLAAQALGLYDTEGGEIFLLTGTVFGPLEEASYAHEYVHYLQDANHDLKALREARRGDRDGLIALTALIEGDATLAQQQYVVGSFSPTEVIALLNAAAGPTDSTLGAPFIVLRSLEFPYLAGLALSNALWTIGGFERVDEAFAAPPTTSEQVLHPEKYLAGEPRIEVTLPDLVAVAGSAWSDAERGVLGEFLLRAWLEALGASAPDAAEAAAGWGGDGYALLDGPEGQTAVVVRLAWDDSERDGPEFFSALDASLESAHEFARAALLSDAFDPAEVLAWDGPGGVIGLALAGSGAVVVAVAPSIATVEALILAALAE